jgi:hypothetical protein
MKRFILLAALAVLLLRPLMSHEHHPPHQGSLQVLGDDFAHLELVLDPVAGCLHAYALDGEAEHPVRLAQKELRLQVMFKPSGRRADLRLKAVANELSGETVGDSSEFEVCDPALRGQHGLKGRLLAVDVRGARFKNVGLLHPEGNEHEEKP